MQNLVQELLAHVRESYLLTDEFLCSAEDAAHFAQEVKGAEGSSSTALNPGEYGNKWTQRRKDAKEEGEELTSLSLRPLAKVEKVEEVQPFFAQSPPQPKPSFQQPEPPSALESAKVPVLPRAAPSPPAVLLSPEAMRAHLASIFPTARFLPTPLPDGQAVQVKDSWRAAYSVVILSNLSPAIAAHEVDQALTFLGNIASAITASFIPARVVDAQLFERQKAWDLFPLTFEPRLLLIPEGLEAHFVDVEEKRKLIMRPPAAYLDNPALKKELWQAIRSLLARF